MRLFHLFTGRNHTLQKMIDHGIKCTFQRLIAFIRIQTAQIRPQLLIGKQTSAMMQRQLQHLVQIEHCSIAPAQIIPLRRQLNTADNGILHCILMGNPQLLQLSYNCFIIEKLRHTASLCHDANSLL